MGTKSKAESEKDFCLQLEKIISERNSHPGTDRVLEIVRAAERSGNIARYCRETGIQRSTMYNWLRKYRENDREDPETLFRRQKHPHQIGADVERSILCVAIKQPFAGSRKISEILEERGMRVSFTTIQKVLRTYGVSHGAERAAMLQKHYENDYSDLSKEQIAYAERYNPSFKERNSTCNTFGEKIALSVFRCGGRGVDAKIFVHLIIDCHSRLALASGHFRANCHTFQELLGDQLRSTLPPGAPPIQFVETDDPGLFERPGGDEFRAFLREKSSVVLLRDTFLNGRNGHLLYLEDTVRQFVSGQLGNLIRVGNLEEVQLRLSAFLEEYNNLPAAGWPNLGRPPTEMLRAPRRVAGGR